MRAVQLTQPNKGFRCCAGTLTAGRSAVPSRLQVITSANWNPLGGKGGKEDAARRALEQSFGQKKKAPDASKKVAKPVEPPKPAAEQPKNTLQSMFGGGGGSRGAPGGGGGGGGGGFFSGGGADQPGGERPILEEFLEIVQGTLVLITNLFLFLAFSSFLHRSLDWFVEAELLVAVGAPQQAGERIVGKFFEVIEWFERSVLGWTLPGDDEEEESAKVYQVLKYYTPASAAYSFAELKYKLSASERDLFFKAYAARHFERMDGRPDEVDPVALQAAKDRLDPMEADRRAYRKAKLEGRLDEYWAAEGREDAYSRVYGGPRTA